MKRTPLLLIVLLLMAGSCYAFEPIFSDEPVAALIGASYAEAEAPENSPFIGGSLNNGAFFDLSDALTAEGLFVVNFAQGGAFSYDVPGTGWKGAQTQVNDLLNSVFPVWPDRVDTVIFTLFNDCLHTIECTEADMDAYWQRVYDAAMTANFAGKCVIVNELPEWDSLHLAEAMDVYKDVLNNGETIYTISEDDYAVLKAKQDAKFGNETWLNYIHPWKRAGIFDDGLHPNQCDMKRAGNIIKRTIKRHCR